jgi:hypothetical protein
MARKPRKMMMFRFWLDQYSPRDEEAGNILYQLRNARDGRYTATIRNGVRLLVSLERGDVSVLLELFPHVQALLLAHQVEGSKREDRRQGGGR